MVNKRRYVISCCISIAIKLLEKSLKAVIARDLPDGEMPPKIHNLIKLTTDASIVNKLSDEQRSLLKLLDPLNIDARYPNCGQDTLSTPTKDIS